MAPREAPAPPEGEWISRLGVREVFPISKGVGVIYTISRSSEPSLPMAINTAARVWTAEMPSLKTTLFWEMSELMAIPFPSGESTQKETSTYVNQLRETVTASVDLSLLKSIAGDDPLSVYSLLKALLLTRSTIRLPTLRLFEIYDRVSGTSEAS